MNPLAKVFVLVDRGDDVRMKVARKRSCEFDSFHSRSRDGAKQTAERRCAFKTFQPIFSPGPVAVYVLTDEMNFFVTMTTQFVDFSDDICSSPARFASARKR